MCNRERFLASHFQSDFFVRQRFQLIREIENHLCHEDGVWQQYADAIEELSDLIVKRELTRYNLTDEYVTRHYGVEDYYETSLISDLAFYDAGCKALKKYATPTLEYLNEVHENMDGGFFMGYQPKKEIFSALVTQLEGMALTVAEKSRDIDRQKGALERFCQELDKIESEDDIIKKINHFNDGAYMEIWGAVGCLAHYLIRGEWWEDYCQLLENLKYFPMQGGVIRFLNSAIDVEAVIDKETARNGRKSLQYLLREQWFRKECEEGELLGENSEIEELIEKDRIFVSGLHQSFENTRKERVPKVVTIWKDVFGKEELSVWASNKVAEAERKHEKYGQPELAVLKLINDEINVTSDDLKNFNLADKDFASLLTFAGTDKDESVAAAVIDAIVDKLFSDRSYPDTALNEKWFEQVRTIYHCLLKSGKNGLALLQTKRKPREGFRVDLVKAMQTERQEAYWLSVMLMSLEENRDNTQFDNFINVLFRDTRYGIDSLTDVVFTPYYVAELLVSQIMPEKKNEYEKRLITEIPHLVFVIRVLSANQGEMSDEIRKLLADRIQREWPLERKLLSQNKMVKIEFYDELVKKYLG